MGRLAIRIFGSPLDTYTTTSTSTLIRDTAVLPRWYYFGRALGSQRTSVDYGIDGTVVWMYALSLGPEDVDPNQSWCVNTHNRTTILEQSTPSLDLAVRGREPRGFRRLLASRASAKRLQQHSMTTRRRRRPRTRTNEKGNRREIKQRGQHRTLRLTTYLRNATSPTEEGGPWAHTPTHIPRGFARETRPTLLFLLFLPSRELGYINKEVGCAI